MGKLLPLQPVVTESDVLRKSIKLICLKNRFTNSLAS